MLSYQHAYHAGNMADVHKHALLSVILDYMVQKDKPLTYIETHAGRGLYDLQSREATKTGESAAGIQTAWAKKWFAADHPYSKVVKSVKAEYGNSFYPGSPMVAQRITRPIDRLHLCEKHPQEYAALRELVHGRNMRHYHADGYETALSLSPPDPRRGMVVIDPSYEVKAEYAQVVDFIAKLHKKWAVGVIALWYPILESGHYADMIKSIENMGLLDVFKHEIQFTMDNADHRLKGSGMLIINAPYVLAQAAESLPSFG